MSKEDLLEEIEILKGYKLMYQNLNKQNKRYREALEFYANRQAYYHTNEHQAEIMLDYGNRARKALEGEE